MLVCADGSMTGTFRNFLDAQVHYKLHQSKVQNFDDGGLLSGGVLSSGLLSVHR